MDPKWSPYGLMAELLDSLNVGVCLFDDDDRTLLWNRTFLRLFPEHDGHVHEGEPYAANLQRFYRLRLGPEELPHIERYVADGIARHRAQARAYVFEHRGQWVRVNAQSLPEGGRIRVWTPIPTPGGDAGAALVLAAAAPATDSTLMANVADGVMLLDARDRIAEVNEPWLLLYGFANREEAIGRRYDEVLGAVWQAQAPYQTPSRSDDHWRRLLAEHRRFAGAPFEVQLPRDRWLRVVEQRARNGVAYSTHVDISELKRQQRLVTAAREAADRANAAKSAFLATMSHEIRTPMNGIIGMNHLLLDSGLDTRQRFYAETIGKSAEILLGLIDDVLDVSRLEAGKVALETIPFDLDELLDGAIRLMMPRAGERGLTLVRTTPGDATGGRVLGDPTRVRQVLLNLISNAVKFTETGGVTVSASAEIGNPAWVTIEVADTGIGLEPTAIERLFERFEQADGTIARRFGGTGLGLHISRQLVELMGGRIGAEPRAAGGSRFWFSLPLPRPAEETTPPRPAAAPAEPARRSGRVLVVEDNLINRLVVEEILTRAGFTVEIATTGTAAIEQVAAALPDLVLMDVQMPGMDGFEATGRIKALSTAAAAVPIVAVTADAMEGDRQRCLAAGMVDYIAKPFEPQALIRTVDRWILGTPAA
jgi:signal transduction histidine kinase/CheY-like chemotaxis protein